MVPLILAAAGLTAAPTPTFAKDVAPILYRNCAGCHRPGEVGPFSLLDYKDAAKRAELLKEVTTARQMPPWPAEPGYGHFLNERRLTDAEVATIAAWADAGAPEGDPKDLPPAPTFPEGWQLGTPDLVLTVSEAFNVPADGPDLFRCFVVPIDLPENRTVAAVEFRPGNPKVVHHALFFLDSTGAARKKDEASPGPGFPSFGGPGFLPTGSLGGWAPGSMPRRLADGLGLRLPKGSDLALQVHYHPSGKPETDRSTLGIYFTKAPAQRIVVGQRLVNRQIDIPPGEAHYQRTAQLEVPVDLKVIGITPHMHLIGREMKVRAIRPDGTEEPLIWIRDWDFNWQGQYTYAEPVRLPAGTRIELTASYDNSADNPRNPSDPPRRVRFGEQTTDEMLFCFLQVVPDRMADYPALRQNRAAGLLRRALGPAAR